MPSENLEQFEMQKLLLDAHNHNPTFTTVKKNLFGFTTTVTIEIPKGQFDWLRSEIGEEVGTTALSNIGADHDIDLGRDEDGCPRIHSTLLGLWRGFN